METLTMDDKQKRDDLFDDLRRTGNDLEKQVVKFSGTRKTEEGNYVSTYSVAYPTQ